MIYSVMCASCLLMIPNYLVWRVGIQSAHIHQPNLYSNTSNETVFWIEPTTGKELEKISFVIMAVFFKIFPVVLIITFSSLLIISIRNARRSRQYLRSRHSVNTSKRELRTTTMLVFIALCTAFVEFPQGLLFIASGIEQRFFLIYSRLGDIMDITTIASSFITFIMYCSMSQQFRQEIVKLIVPESIQRHFMRSPVDTTFDLQQRSSKPTVCEDFLTNSCTVNQNERSKSIF